MPKRFTATEKWSDPWFNGLTGKDKLFWLYLLDSCDHAGIWRVNWPLARFHLGADFTYCPDAFKDRITALSPDKWFIPKFVAYQYGSLNPSNRAHASVVSLLKKEGAYKVLTSPMLGAKDKDKEQDKDKDTARGLTGRCQNRDGCGLAANWVKGYGRNGDALCADCLEQEAVSAEIEAAR